MQIIITKDYDELSEKAFAIVKEVVKSNKNAVLGLATGSTPLGLYKQMIVDHKKNGTSYANVKSVNLDEYKGLDKNHNQSYAYFMRTNLFEGLDIDLNNTNIPNGIAKNAEQECCRYNNLLNTLRQDVQILGIGSNGHIAFNEPGTPFNSTVHTVHLAESTIKDNSRLFEHIEDVPKQAYTMGLKNIMNAKKIVILASGKNKQNAVYALVKGEMTEQVPASILQKHSDCILICDKDAAERIL